MGRVERTRPKSWTHHAALSREAACECSPRRVPWVKSKEMESPEGAKEKDRFSIEVIIP
jgi:hypothetical protein